MNNLSCIFEQYSEKTTNIIYPFNTYTRLQQTTFGKIMEKEEIADNEQILLLTQYINVIIYCFFNYREFPYFFNLLCSKSAV